MTSDYSGQVVVNRLLGGTTSSGLRAFVETARLGGFAKAGRAMGMTASGVAKAVQRLEMQLGAPLFTRSTRRLAMTAEGAILLGPARRIVAAAEDADIELSTLRDLPAGLLKVSISPGFGRSLLLRSLSGFRRKYPAIRLEIDVTSRYVDIVGDGFDLALRVGPSADSALVGRRLTSIPTGLYAAPSYLASRTIDTVEDLHHVDCIRYRSPTTGLIEPWVFRDNWIDVRVPETIVFSDPSMIYAAAGEGLGVAKVPDYAIAELGSRQLAPVSRLKLAPTETTEAWLLWPVQRHQFAARRAFVDYLLTASGEEFTVTDGHIEE